MRKSFLLSILLLVAKSSVNADPPFAPRLDFIDGERGNDWSGLVESQGIVGGDDIEPGEYPYFVEMITSFCGGTLIAPDIVLTAAHCPDYTGVDIKIGSYRRNSLEGGAEYRTCTQWVPHPDFVAVWEHQDDYSDFLDYDFALCKLGEPVFVDESVGKLVVNKDPDYPPAGEMATMIGLGRLYNNGPIANYTQHVDAPVVSNEECYAAWDSLGFKVIDDGSLKICVGIWDPNTSDNPSSCGGDSGGPNVIKTEDGKHILFGITSFGHFCGSNGIPGGKARVSAVTDWIEETACGILGSEYYCASEVPSVVPTQTPSDSPTASPTASPTVSPTASPSESPTTKSEKKKSKNKKEKRSNKKEPKTKKSKAKKSKSKKNKPKKSKAKQILV